jgi:Translation initiation factor IF-3, C-terminal domain
MGKTSRRQRQEKDGVELGLVKRTVRDRESVGSNPITPTNLRRINIAGKQKKLQLSVRISEHDYGYRVKQAQKWLAQKDTVLAVVQFKGREISHKELGEKLLEKLMTDLGKKGKPVLKNGRDLQVLITN